MFDYVNNRKFYSTDSEFLSGNDVFTGYVLRKDNMFTDLFNFPLTSASTFATDLVSSDYFRDRVVTDVLQLTHTLSSIQIDVNDILTNRLVNEKLTKLNDNITYLYSRLQTPANYLPAADNVQYAAVSSIDGVEQFVWYNSIITTTEWGETTDYTGFENINRGVAVVSDYNEDVFTLFCTTSSSFIALTGTSTNLDRIEESVFVTQSASDLQFENITSIDYSDSTLYICDKGNNAVYKYDVDSYLTGDTGFKNRRILIENLGSIGNAEDRGLLNEPTLVAAKTDSVAVYDSGNTTLKIYDQNFNFRCKLNAGNFRREPALAIKYNNFTNELFVITQTADDTLKLYKVQNDFTVDDGVIIDETIESDEEVIEISFSPNNSNYWYLVTTHFVYKKLVNKPKNSIGAYDGGKLFTYYTYRWNYAVFTYNAADIVWNSTGNRTSSYDNFIGITLDSSEHNYDKAFLFKYGRFYKYDEPNSYLNLLNFTNKTNYSIDNIKLSNKEFVQPAVYNKEIYKIISNLLALKNNIIGRYFGSYDLNGVFRLTSYDYLIDLDKFVIDNIRNFTVHQNEEVNYYTINRTLQNLYNLQQTLLNVISIDVEGLIPYPLTSNTLIVD